MKRLNLYLARHVIFGIVLSIALVLSIDTLFTLVNELRYVGRGDYTFWRMIFYVLLSLPQRIYQFFPMAALLGTLMGLGTLAQRSELIIMRATGWSVLQIGLSVLKTGLVLALLVWGLGEVVAPFADNLANNQRAIALSGGQALRTDQGTWMRDGDDFVHIRAIDMEGRLEGVTRYQFDENLKLKQASFARFGDYVDNHWELHDIQSTSLSGQTVTTETKAQEIWQSVIDPEILKVVGVSDLEQLSLVGLWRTIRYRQANGLERSNMELVFWNKIVQPFTALTMMLLAIPFIFGPLRQSSMGLKVVTGIVVGFTFFTLNSLLGPLMLVYQSPAFIGAILPTLLFMLIGMQMMKRTF